MAIASKSKLKLGDEVLYVPNKHVDPLLLTFVETMKNGLDRYFSSEFPTMEYHLEQNIPSILPYEEKYVTQPQEAYVAFKGKDGSKRLAYESLLLKRGLPIRGPDWSSHG